MRRATTSGAASSCSPHENAAISTTAASGSSRAAASDTAGWWAATSAARRRTDGVGVGERPGEELIVEHAQPFEGADGAGPDGGVVVGQCQAGDVLVAAVTGHHDEAPALGRRHFTMLSRNTNAPTISPAVTTASTAPRMMPSAPAPTSDASRCHHAGGR